MAKIKGLVIRCFMNGYYLCDGKPPQGKENDGQIYIGNAVKWFPTFKEAEEMRIIINEAYEDKTTIKDIENEQLWEDGYFG